MNKKAYSKMTQLPFKLTEEHKMLLKMQEAGFTNAQINSDKTFNNCSKLVKITQDECFGRDGLMAVASFRYCLGRVTYIVDEFSRLIIKQWPILPEPAKKLIERELDDAFKKDDYDRLDGKGYYALGNDCDRESWEKVRNLWSKK